MSYILNALRKSEQERQAIEPDTITSRINIHQPQPRRNSNRLIIAALLISNLAIILYFLEFSGKNLPDVAPAMATATKPEPALPAEKTAQQLPVSRLPKIKNPPVAEIVETKAVPVATPPADKPVAAKKQVADAEAPAAVAPSLPTPQINQSVEAAIKPDNHPAPPPPVVAEKSSLPFMEELPAEVRRSLPTLHINVYGYSSVPAERFVIIDMVKYVVGQRINDMLELKEIRENGFVVGYGDVVFKIRRP